MNIMEKINMDKVAKVFKVLGYVLPALGGIAGAVASTHDIKQTTIKTTEQMFNEHIQTK